MCTFYHCILIRMTFKIIGRQLSRKVSNISNSSLRKATEHVYTKT